MPTDFRRRERPFTQLARPLSFASESGLLSREVGLIPRRQHQLPHNRRIGECHVLYAHPPIHHPRPGR